MKILPAITLALEILALALRYWLDPERLKRELHKKAEESYEKSLEAFAKAVYGDNPALVAAHLDDLRLRLRKKEDYRSRPEGGALGDRPEGSL